MSDYVIRAANTSDLDSIVKFNQAMAMETEGKHLPDSVIRPGVEGLYARPQYGFYLVAEHENSVIGSLMITYEWSDWRNGLIWWIQSVYTVPKWRRHGVYKALYQYVKKAATEDGMVRGFRLYVEKENDIAQQTYLYLGMEDSGYYLFEEMLPSS